MKNLVKKVVNKIIKKRMTISFAESCSGGLLSSYVTSVKGASKIFILGVVTYSNKSKVKVLKIPKNTIKKYGAVSPQVCSLMAKNLYKITKTKISVSITGIAGPRGGSKSKPIGLVYVCVKKDKKIKVVKYLFKNKGRAYIQKNSVKKSLELILNELE